jgi:hypothetical protein
VFLMHSVSSLFFRGFIHHLLLELYHQTYEDKSH